jgi:proteasome lid subunit RPN8/RPN11
MMEIMITAEAMEKMATYIDCCSTEISGLGIVEQVKASFLIRDVFILEQATDFARSNLDQNDLNRFLFDMVSKGEPVENVKLWWHSHVNMDVFWSGTDEKTAESFRNQWMISIVENKKGEYRVRLDIYEPFRMTFDNLALKVVFGRNIQLREKITEEISQKVTSLYQPIKAYTGEIDDQLFATDGYPSSIGFAGYESNSSRSWRNRKSGDSGTDNDGNQRHHHL